MNKLWSIVVFEEENAVEVVPSTWFKNHTCAWPNTTNVSKYIKHRVLPNKHDFTYLPARKLCKDVGRYKIFIFTLLKIIY